MQIRAITCDGAASWKAFAANTELVNEKTETNRNREGGE